MAITIISPWGKTKFPSGSGPTKCSKCGGRAYATYGEDTDGKFFYKECCFESECIKID